MPADRGALHVRGTTLRWGTRTFVMGIVNATPDSFSGDGREETAAAVAHALAQAASGADIIDIGGESTRPGHVPVDAQTEIARVIPVIAGVRAALPHAVVSVDTTKAEVLRAAHAAGADILNCVWGLPDELLDLAARLGMPVIAMHNKREARYDGDVVDEVLGVLEAAALRAVRRGIPAPHVILDPGIGFGKTAEHNLEVLRALPRLVTLGFPTLVGTSRKSFIGRLTGKESPVERVAGTLATSALAAAAGIDVVRVHDVAEHRDALAVADAIVHGWRPAGWTP